MKTVKHTSMYFLGKHSNKTISTETLLQLNERILFISMDDVFHRSMVSPWERKWDLVSLAYSWDIRKSCFLLGIDTPHQHYTNDMLTISLELYRVLKMNYNALLILLPTSIRLSNTHVPFQTTQSLSLTYS